MAKREGTTYVTRRDFYQALVVVWLYIMLIISNSMGPNPHWRMYLYFAGSLFLMIAYAIMTFRSGGRGAGNERDSEASGG